jgi:hypothetical protein
MIHGLCGLSSWSMNPTGKRIKERITCTCALVQVKRMGVLTWFVECDILMAGCNLAFTITLTGELVMASGNADTSPLLRQFTVKGYKNLTQDVTFGPLGRINVVHGENNVGKSNLLQAMDLFFRLLGLESTERDFVIGGVEGTLDISHANFEKLGHPVEEIFNFIEPTPIEMVGTFSFTIEQQKHLDYSLPFVEIGLQMSRTARKVEIQIVRLDPNLELRVLRQVLEFLFQVHLWQAGKTSNRFALLGVNRRILVEDATPPSLHIVPQKLRDALFDAKESREGALARRWELFVEMMKQFEHISGPGQFATAFDRQSNQADLVLDRGDVRVPVDLLGSGVQQIVALLGQLLMTPATLVGIEEPELNLRYTLQKQLLKALQQIAASEYGPEQIFLSSHSPAFEAEEHFFGMEMGDDGPMLSRRPRAMVRIYTGTRDEEDLYPDMLAQEPEPPCYVSSEGLVMLPQDVRRALKIEGGGGVSFIPNKESGRLEIWTTDEIEQWWVGVNDRDADE